MEKQNNSSKENQSGQDISIDIIAVLILVYGLINIFSSVVYSFSHDPTDKWFTRMGIGIICAGFYCVIMRLKK